MHPNRDQCRDQALVGSSRLRKWVGCTIDTSAELPESAAVGVRRRERRLRENTSRVVAGGRDIADSRAATSARAIPNSQVG